MRWGIHGERRSVEEVKRDGWREQSLLAVSVDDHRLTWPEREFVKQLGNKLYGSRGAAQHGGERHDPRT